MRLTRMTVIAAAVLASFLATASAHAYLEQEDITKRWGLGLTAAAATSSEDDPDAGVYFGMNVTYGVMDYLALQMDFGYHEFSYKAFGVDFGDLETIPLILSLQPRYPFEIGATQAALYGLIGAGIVFHDFQVSDQITELGRSVEADDAFAFRLGLGMDWFLTRNFATNIEASWTMVARDVVLSAPEISAGAEDIDTDFWNVGAGIKYYFD